MTKENRNIYKISFSDLGVDSLLGPDSKNNSLLNEVQKKGFGNSKLSEHICTLEGGKTSNFTKETESHERCF